MKEKEGQPGKGLKLRRRRKKLPDLETQGFPTARDQMISRRAVVILSEMLLSWRLRPKGTS
ncbi:MAG: hypothetical protein AB7P49_09625 [Bdellovibrionales bacterium]